MPGVVTLHVWRRRGGAAAEFLHTRRLAVFDAAAGAPWAGFCTFMSSLAREYDCEAIFDAAALPPAPPGAPTPPPPLTESNEQPSAPTPPSLLRSAGRTERFPASGELALVIVAPERKADQRNASHTALSASETTQATQVASQAQSKRC